MKMMDDVLDAVRRCPHCGVANPQMTHMWGPQPITPRGEARPIHWAAFICTSCLMIVLARTYRGVSRDVERIYPGLADVNSDLPERARTYLIQAIESLHAPDGAAMLAGSAVDSMLKARGLTEGSLYDRIGKAIEQHLLTSEMGEWAHAVRLESNRPRHADQEDPHVTREQAEQSIEFAKALGDVLFALPARVARGKQAAEGVEGKAGKHVVSSA